MTPDNAKKLDRLTVQLREAIDLNGGVECAQNPEIFYPDDWNGLGGSTTMKNLATRTAKEICMSGAAQHLTSVKRYANKCA